MYWNHMDLGWGVLMTVGWIVLIALLIVVLVNATRDRQTMSARDLLDTRLAAGEISVEEYERARAAITSEAGSRPASGPPAPA